MGNDSHTGVFIGMVLDMSWRLAVVVILPLVGGFKLDQKLSSTPWLTIVGFIVAMAGTTLVLWSSVKKANQLGAQPKETKS